MEIEQVYDILVQHKQGQKIKCPNCHKSGFVFCQDRVENVNEGLSKQKTKEIRLLFFCLYCDFELDGVTDLKNHGIPPEVDK